MMHANVITAECTNEEHCDLRFCVYCNHLKLHKVEQKVNPHEKCDHDQAICEVRD